MVPSNVTTSILQQGPKAKKNLYTNMYGKRRAILWGLFLTTLLCDHSQKNHVNL